MCLFNKNSNIHLVGLGGAGKSTVGNLLADKINFKFIDLDIEFKNQFGDITVFIHKFGKYKYQLLNTQLFHELINYHNKKTIFALPAGLIYSKNQRCWPLNSRNQYLISKNGFCVLLLPSKNKQKTKEILVQRQLSRGLDYNKADIEKDIDVRFAKFLILGDIKIFSTNKPKKIVETINNKLIDLWMTK